MKSITLIFAVILLIFSSLIFANVIYTPEHIKVLSVNGEKQTNFFNPSHSFELNHGNNYLTLQYNELFEDYDNDDHVTVKSKPFNIRFNHSNKQPLTLSTPKINDVDSARVYAKSPNVHINDESGNMIALTIHSQSEYLALNNKDDLVNHEKHKTPVDEVHSVTIAEKSQQKEKTIAPTTNALTMLNYWWEEADNQQKRAFIKSIKRTEKEK